MEHFQTPIWVAEYLVDLIEKYPKSILEPTPGEGNLLTAIRKKYPDTKIIAPKNFENLTKMQVDYVIANPPFTPMSLGYSFLEKFFDYSDNVISIMPWLSIINSEKRTKQYINRGLKEIHHLPRRAFPGSRVQTCILKFEKYWNKDIKIFFDIKIPISTKIN